MILPDPLARLALLVSLLALAAWPASALAINFTGPTYYPAGDPVADHALQDIAAGDFNGDGDPDLAVVHQDKDRVQIFLGSTGGTFTGPTNIALFSHANPLGIAIGNFNGGNDPDLAVADEGSSDDNPQTTPGRVSVLLGSSGASFTAPTSFTAGFKPQAIAIADFNGDANADLGVANQGSEPGQGTSAGSVSVLLGGGAGTFGAATSYSAGLVLRDIGTGDFNGDSHPDLAVVNQGNGSTGSQQISILLGTASGTFTGPTNYSPTAGCGGAPEAVGIGDFNGDSDPDLAVANETCPSLVVMPGSAGGSFGSATSFGTGSAPKDVGVGEFNDDRDPDLVIPNHGSHNASVLLGGAGGSFTGPTNFNSASDPLNPTADGPAGVAIADFNADGFLDFAVANDNTSSLAIFLGTRPYSRPTGGTPLRVPLVPAFKECTASNSTHGGGLPEPQACSEPGLISTTAQLGSSTAPGTRVGFARIDVCLTNTAAGCAGLSASQIPDVRLRGNGSDVACQAGAPADACPAGPGSDYNPNASAGPYLWGLANPGGPTCSPVCSPNSNKDFPTTSSTPGSDTPCNPTPPNPPACDAGADMTAIASIPDSSNTTSRSIRVTDSFNDTASAPDLPACGSTTSCSGTVRDQAFPIPVVCESNSDLTVGSYCGVNTTANALFPGTVATGKAAIVEVGDIQVLDSGPDGTRGNSDDQLFAVQGIYIP